MFGKFGGEEVEKMQEMNLIVALFMGLMLAKKKETRKFGQMTLNMGGQALEYLKTSVKPIVRQANRIEWANKMHISERFELPPWVLPVTEEDKMQYKNADRTQDVAVIHDADPAIMPLLVYQTTALRGLDECLAQAQEDGAMVEDDGKQLTLDMGDKTLEISFIRNPKAGKFAPFIVTLRD